MQVASIDLSWVDAASKLTLTAAAIGVAAWLAKKWTDLIDKDRARSQELIDEDRADFKKVVEKTVTTLDGFTQVKDSLGMIVQQQQRQLDKADLHTVMLEEIRHHVKRLP